MVMVTVEEAKKDLNALVKRVKDGEEVILTDEGVAVARLSGAQETPKERIPGGAEWLFPQLPDLDAPLPDDLREAFGA
jgi:prevent-host-death family protein